MSIRWICTEVTRQLHLAALQYAMPFIHACEPPMKRVIAASLFLICQAPAMAAGAVQCQSQAPGYDSLDVKCPLPASVAAAHYRFKANFSGGHDDTKATITPTLDGAPLACGEGSKISLFGEDGDVSLECRFSIPAKTAGQPVFGALVWWSHAQYTDFEFDSE
jgi:hypothetical protein